MNADKANIRLRIREQRKDLVPAWVRQTSDRIQGLVQDLEEWRAANQVCCYLAVPGEVQTEGLLKACWKLKKRVCVPAFRKAPGRYDLAWYDGGDLAVGYGSVPEPAEPRWIENLVPDEADSSGRRGESVDLVIVPGLAFDRSGARLGHGRGHYDRLLRIGALKRAFKLGLAFEFQMLDAVPVDIHDVRMDAVVTEKTVYRR